MATSSDYLAATGAALNTTANALAQSDINRRTRRWNEAMYDKQRQHALADWHMQNSYNHPSAQMARLREAGLNPNLVYGTGSVVANATQMPAHDSTPSWNPRAVEVGNSIAQYFNVMTQEAQLDNLRAQNDVLTEEALLKRTQRMTGEFTLGLESELRDHTMQGRIMDTGLKTSQYSLSRFEVETIQAYREANNGRLPQLDEILIDLANKRAQGRLTDAQIRNIRNDSQLKELDIDLRKMGINPNDPIYLRIIGRLLNSITEKIESFRLPNWLQ